MATVGKITELSLTLGLKLRVRVSVSLKVGFTKGGLSRQKEALQKERSWGFSIPMSTVRKIVENSHGY